MLYLCGRKKVKSYEIKLMNRKFTTWLLLWCLALGVWAANPLYPKREFRGAWIQAVNGQFQGMSAEKMQQTLIAQLNSLQQAGINAIIFQVRPEADALYASSYEPWSRFLTGRQGQAPSPYWDPLQFMIDECHRRNMELHAWINPYRAKTKGTTVLAANHPSKYYPDRFFSYDGLLLFDPGCPENINYICRIVQDIVSRYDVDGLHIDDYFYPYPVSGLEIPDRVTFAQYGRGYDNINDWRRDNVSQLIRALHETIRHCKPWVKFGISPFGIYRNQKNDPKGSATNGLQNYDDLYADILLWIEKGWIDYNVPQVYWEIGNRAADYETLVNWWAANAAGRPLIIGQDVERTVKYADPQNPSTHQQVRKMNLQRSLPAVKGSCQWPAASVVQNVGGYRDQLVNSYHRYPALMPLFSFMDDKAPAKVRKSKVVWTSDGPVLFWNAPKYKQELDRAAQYVVYRFRAGEAINLDDASKIVAITRECHYNLPYQGGKTKYTYVVTALDRLQNESKPVKKAVKL
jgi:uncharacterized lipoprotein YddW (UPF0748 family)